MDPHCTVFPLALSDSLETIPYLSLGMITAFLRTYDDGILERSYRIAPIQLGGLPTYSLEAVYQSLPGSERAICLLSSYVWNHQVNIAAARQIKINNPQVLVIVGGPEVPKYPGETEAFLNEHRYIDIAVLGEGEISCAEVLQQLALNNNSTDSLADVEGIVYRSSSGVLRTPDRQRVVDVNALPSPYLTGEFEPWFHHFSNTILETNRGCPYGCTYCDWGSATLQKVTRFDPARVISEIEYIAGRSSEAIFIADANFGMLEQDIEIAEALVAVRQRTGYPRRLYTNFAKNGGRRLMSVIRILHRGGLLPTGIIALQTTDAGVLKAIKRDNIKTASYEKMMEYFNSENIPMASDIMIGLPGQTPDSLQKDLQFCFDWKVSANGNYTSMMPNAPMAESSYREQHKIATDSQGMIASTSSFTAQDLHYMKCLFATYEFHVRLGVLKYYLYFLQLDHGVPALELLRAWMDAVRAGDEQLPLSGRLYHDVFAMDTRQGHWGLLSWGDEAEFLFSDIERYYQEFHAFAQRQYQLDIDSCDCESLFAAQAAVMPRLQRKYPFVASLDRDIVRYFEQLKTAPSIDELDNSYLPLTEFTSGELRVAPKLSGRTSYRFQHIDGHTDAWELKSELRFY